MTKMPCAATNRVPKPWAAMGAAVDIDAVLAFMKGLAQVLGEVAAENDKHRRRLFSLEADVEAFCRLIGTAPAEVTP